MLAGIGLRGQLERLRRVGPRFIGLVGGEQHLGAGAQQRHQPAPAGPGVELEQRPGAGQRVVGRSVVAALQMGDAEFHQRVAARLGPRKQTLRHLVAFQTQADRRVVVVQLEVDATDHVRGPRHPELVVGAVGVAAHIGVPAQCLLVAAARQVGVAELKQRVTEDVAGVGPFGQHGAFLKVGQTALDVRPPLQHGPQEDQRARAQAWATLAECLASAIGPCQAEMNALRLA